MHKVQDGTAAAAVTWAQRQHTHTHTHTPASCSLCLQCWARGQLLRGLTRDKRSNGVFFLFFCFFYQDVNTRGRHSVMCTLGMVMAGDWQHDDERRGEGARGGEWGEELQVKVDVGLSFHWRKDKVHQHGLRWDKWVQVLKDSQTGGEVIIKHMKMMCTNTQKVF